MYLNNKVHLVLISSVLMYLYQYLGIQQNQQC